MIGVILVNINEASHVDPTAYKVLIKAAAQSKKKCDYWIISNNVMS